MDVSGSLGPVDVSELSRAVLRPVGDAQVRLHDRGLLGEWQALNSAATIPHCIEHLETSGALDNLRRLVGESDAEFVGPQFTDSDVYKVLEAIAWDVPRSGRARFADFVADTTDLLRRAQEPSGYLNSYVQGVRAGDRQAFQQGIQPQKPFASLRWSHELYCLGHLIQAAIAWKRVCDSDELLDIAIRYVDLVERELGDDGREAVDGHPEIETALIELSRTTGEERFLDLARRFLDLRGKGLLDGEGFGLEYFQDHEPVRQVTEATGHAVRQIYLATAMTDLVLHEPDAAMSAALEALWTSVHREKMYVSGGLGSRHRDESFGDPFELPADRAYAETCAAIANFMWNWRMLLLRGEGRFADEMERSLYNAIAVSTSQSGTAFFYSNPLHLREGHRSHEDAPSRRLEWFGCACCPPNLARLIASIASYVATKDDSGLQLHLYADGAVEYGDGSEATTATIRTDYPWSGSVSISFDRPYPGTELRLRRPSWSEDVTVRVNGELVHAEERQGYLVLDGRLGMSEVSLEFALRPVAVQPHPRIDAVRGCVALQRGPVLYCAETVDLGDDIELHSVRVPPQPTLTVGHDDRLAAPTIVVLDAFAVDQPSTATYTTEHVPSTRRPVEITAVPYFRWANREPGAMRVWLPVECDG